MFVDVSEGVEMAQRRALVCRGSTPGTAEIIYFGIFKMKGASLLLHPFCLEVFVHAFFSVNEGHICGKIYFVLVHRMLRNIEWLRSHSAL